MPRIEVIEVSDWLIEQTPELKIRLAGQDLSCCSGKQLGSLYAGDCAVMTDYLPQEMLKGVTDGRPAVLAKRTSRSLVRNTIGVCLPNCLTELWSIEADR